MGHFYLPNTGEPFYKVPYADPKKGLRDATLRDARKVNAYPSVTTVMNVVAKPQLENWKIEQNIMAALTNPEITPDMNVKDIMRIIKRDAMEQAREAANKGTEIHDAIEAWFKGKPVPAQHLESVQAVIDLLQEKCGKQEWEAEKWFASSKGYGGKIDLISTEWAIDFKTKDGDVSELKMYPDQAIQLAAYDKGTAEESLHPWRRHANILISRDIPGCIKFWEWEATEGKHSAMQQFEAALTLWQLQKNYFPQMDKAA